MEDRFKSPSVASWTAHLAFLAGNVGSIQTASERARRAVDAAVMAFRQREVGREEARA